MADLFRVHYYEPVDLNTELEKHVVAVDEPDCRAYLEQQESNSVIAAGWTIFNMGAIEGAPGVFGPTQLTRAVDGRWNETAWL